MNEIVSPVKFNMQGPQVADLHSALLALLDRAFILPGDEGVRQAAAAALQSELAPAVFGNVTGKLVSTFQGERALPVTGDVNEQTANAFNKLLADAGLLDLEQPSAFRLVTGFVRREDGLPLQGARVRASHVADGREIRLADDSADAEGRYTIRYDALPGAGGVNLKVSAIAEDGRTIGVSAVITNAKIVEIVDLAVPLVAPAEGRQAIQGTILLEHGQPAADGFLREVARSGGELIEARHEIPACRSALIPQRQKKTRVRRPACDKDRDTLLQQLQVDSTANAQSQLVRRSRQNYAVAVRVDHPKCCDFWTARFTASIFSVESGS